MRIFANANFPFLSWRRKAFIGSAIFMLIGLVAIGFNLAAFGSWLRYGIDFAGGTVVHVDFEEQVQIEQVRAINPGPWEFKRFGEPEESEYEIRIPSSQDQLDIDPASTATTRLSEAFGEDAYQIVAVNAVGPRVGAELQQRALLAILISFVLTLIYVAFRFEWRFGVAAIVATLHDILLTLGFIAALRMEISVGTVAAFLTIVGYSLNDTIVVFDRVRENLGKAKRGEAFVEIANRSINDTLPRTVLTTGTTLATLFSLYLFGGEVIRDFALVLILGIGLGTFSSIFIAAPVLTMIEAKWPRAAKKPGRGSSASSRRETARV